MSLKWKQKQILQKEYWEQQLKARLAVLAGKGIEGARVDKDPLAKKIKASIHATDNRLRQIAANEKITEEMARIKAERAAAPKEKEKEKEKEHGKGEKPKKAAGEGKEKKPKAEKKPGPAKDKAGDKGQKPAAPPEEDKAK